MKLNIQQILQDADLILYPLEEQDFDGLLAVASDPEIWAQHPNRDRWKTENFRIFFEGAIKSGGAYKIVDKSDASIVGSTRFYDHNTTDGSIFIGYTFYSRACWGKGINQKVKKLMLDHIFQYVSKVYFQIGAENVRSQIAIARTGAKKIGEEEVAYFGEAPKLNFIYAIERNSNSKSGSVVILPAGTDDVAVLQKIGRETFYETFAESNTPENMQDYLEKSFDTEKIKGEVMNPDSFFFIAWDGTAPIAYLKLNTGKAQTEPQEAGALEVERIYVLKQYHGRNIGQLLYNKALEVAESQNKSFIWLGVWENNFRALRFYEKNGFSAFDKHIFRMGDDEQTDIMMKKELP